MLFIVGTKWHHYDEVMELPNDQMIKYPENVKVISHDLFANLIGLEGDNRTTYNRIIDLNYDNDLEAITALYNCELSYINTYNTEELKHDLMQTGLIKENFDDYFDFEVLNNNRKQIDLDHFLNR